MSRTAASVWMGAITLVFVTAFVVVAMNPLAMPTGAYLPALVGLLALYVWACFSLERVDQWMRRVPLGATAGVASAAILTLLAFEYFVSRPGVVPGAWLRLKVLVPVAGTWLLGAAVATGLGRVRRGVLLVWSECLAWLMLPLVAAPLAMGLIVRHVDAFGSLNAFWIAVWIAGPWVSPVVAYAGWRLHWGWVRRRHGLVLDRGSVAAVVSAGIAAIIVCTVLSLVLWLPPIF